MKRIIFLLLMFLLSSCVSQFKVAEIDPATGYFPSNKKANIIKNEKYDLDSMKSLIVVSAGKFVEGQVKNIGYFDEVINLDDLQTAIVQEGLQDEVPSVSDKIGINKAYSKYKPFLWLRYDSRVDGRKSYAQFILTDPQNLNDIFIAERYLDYIWSGVNDQSAWYPLCNSLIDYIREHSKTYK